MRVYIKRLEDCFSVTGEFPKWSDILVCKWTWFDQHMTRSSFDNWTNIQHRNNIWVYPILSTPQYFYYQYKWLLRKASLRLHISPASGTHNHSTTNYKRIDIFLQVFPKWEVRQVGFKWKILLSIALIHFFIW